MLDIIAGQKRNVFGIPELRAAIDHLDPNGTLYIGYPIIATADEPVIVEALLTCAEYGVVVFDMHVAGQAQNDREKIADRQNDLYTALYQRLLAFKPLRDGRSLAVKIQVVSVIPTNPAALEVGNNDVLVATPEELPALLGTFAPISDEQLRRVNAAIQRITTIKPANKRTTVTKANSRGAVMQRIEAEIANLDQWQKRAAIESPDGPQRVRGLAGSGKTIVLALKAAYLHAQNPDWDIVVTFSTRALRQQFVDLIRRFCFEHLNDEPNWSKVRVLQSWGASRSPGVYSEIAAQNDLPFYDFLTARRTFGYESAFEGACSSLLDALRAKRKPKQLFDAILIDEAQDLPTSFFELCYLSTRDPKRVVFAYDELQNIGTGAFTVAAPSELFGLDERGEPRVRDLPNSPNEPRQDIILPVCYRNTPWALTTAHAVGFGIYRDKGLLQYFDDASLWTDVGYEVLDGELELGRDVVIARRENSYPAYFASLLTPADAVLAKTFATREEQATWVADEIARNVSEDELSLRDILVIVANPLTSRQEGATIIEALNRVDIPAHLAGVTASVDHLFLDDSVAVSGIYRAKGNEAPMVYIVNSEYCIGGLGQEMIRRRNILFTGITRSRAWVRILGTGTGMDVLRGEIEGVASRGYKLAFRVPTESELTRMRKIQRDISKKERAAIEKATTSFDELLSLIESGTLDREHLPPELLSKLTQLVRDTDSDDGK
jgi:superfamily I DNA and RNA helicase